MSGAGISGLLKEGTKHLTGLEEAILRNIEACKGLSQITRTSLGPNGMNKMVITQHDKLFVTSDAATIVKEMDVVHPAAKMLVMASEQQEQECGDATNLVIVFGGELLGLGESLIRMGLHPADIISGYQKASKKILELIETPELTVHKLENPRDVTQVAHCLKTVLAAKQYGHEDLLAPLVAQACIQILPKNGLNFSVDNVRVAKILGGGVVDTKLVKGFVLTRDVEGTIKHVTNAKVAVFVAGIDLAKPESKGTVLIKTAEQLKNYTLEEEKQMEKIVKEIADSGAKVVVSGAAISELALHFLERYKLMAVKVTSKFNLRRVCKATGATALVRLLLTVQGAPTAEELGFADVINVEEIGSTKVTIFRQDKEESQLSTLIVRASTQNMLDDIERAVDDAANAFRTMLKDGRFVAGAGATEIELARRLFTFAEASPGVEQYAIKKFAEALEVVPRTLAENAGLPASDTVAALYAAHSAGKIHEGIDVESGQIKNVSANGVIDSLVTKSWALRFACDAVVTILRVDQIIMAKPAGGPKPRAPRAADADDDAPDLD